ncbi:MAG: sigma-54-dependent Fis family transcriptional regulator [Deltaproteobacteria bacterium]|nr:sigma-54-dependent Fis family transcriptional regulator [Deltaproteobacteria bacterium]
MVPKILVVDDEENMLRLFKRVLGKEGYEVRTAGSGTEGLRLLKEEDFDLIISDLVMPILGGLELMQAVKEEHPDLPFILITAFGSIGSAVEAIKAGAYDYLTKPFHKEEILSIVRKALKVSELRQEVKRLRDELKTLVGFNRLIFKSKAMESVFKLMHKVADSQATVLIQGESGTGKELVARALHDLSSRRDGPFIAVDCSVLPEQLLQTELFGHIRGAFTGALKDKDGLFLAAHHGTLFLDEIGNISSPVQLNLLRVLQEREIKPVGSLTSTKVDVRVVAATNLDLEQLIKQGIFRKDLYYRLAVVTVHIPPLRDRREDIAPLAYHFLHKYAQIYQREVTEISPLAMRLIMDKPWPGNVRELENVMERAVILSSGPILDETLIAQPSPAVSGHEGLKQGLKEATRGLTRQREMEALFMALKDTQGNKAQAARLLGISRTSLYNKIKEMGLEV